MPGTLVQRRLALVMNKKLMGRLGNPRFGGQTLRLFEDSLGKVGSHIV